MDKVKNILPGIILTTLVAFLSIYLSNFITLGSVAIAILIGFIINNLSISKSNVFNEGISFSEKTLLSIAIVLLGSYMNIGILSYVSINNIILIVLTILVSIFFCSMTIIMSYFPISGLCDCPLRLYQYQILFQ